MVQIQLGAQRVWGYSLGWYFKTYVEQKNISKKKNVLYWKKECQKIGKELG
ncbi:MAG: hypothetical protein OES27_07890 [Nitrosopumilus sp.]|jgi:hypothetical protein|nr:hypothetical protein [Nitrosopumilus sp.]